MAEPITYAPMDWGEAQQHTLTWRNFFRSFEEIERVLAAAGEARNWLATGQREVTQLQEQVAAAKAQQAEALEAVKQAKRVQVAAEQAAAEAQKHAKAEDAALVTRKRDTDAVVAAVMAQGEAAEKQRQAQRDAAHAARVKELTTELNGIEKEIARTKRVLAELRSQPIGA